MRIARWWILTLALGLLLVMPALAHEGKEAGPYHLHFGWRVEPAYAGLPNGPEIFIEMEDESEFAEETPVALQAEVTFGDATTTVSFKAAYGEVGHYISNLIPTLPGDYQFHITGTIGDTDVDLVYDSADGGFGTVEPVQDILFPALPSTDDRIAALEAKLADLEARLAQLEGK